MFNFAQGAQDAFQDFRGESEWVATRKQHVTHLGGTAQVIKLCLKILRGKGLGRVTHQA